VDTQTRHALKQDSFVRATTSGLGWLQDHRANTLRTSIAVVAVLAVAIGGSILYNQRNEAARNAFGQALEVYTSPLQQPGAPVDASQPAYTTSADRAKEANREFVAIADRYGWLSTGINARYFAGLSFVDMGQTGAAETALKQVADSRDRSLANLAKYALAGLYHQSGRDPQAVELYQQLIAKPTDSVPASAAKLALADLYAPTNPAQAKKLYAEIQDKDKASAAAQIAAEKLKSLP
jgi:predicted negative regulator of RcsB-dependent stress response